MASVTDLTPPEGKKDHIAVIHGTGFAGASTISVKFGSASGVNPVVPGNSDVNIKVTIPAKAPTDPNPLIVKVYLDNDPTPVAGNTMKFRYLDEPVGVPAPTLTAVPAQVVEMNTYIIGGTGFQAASASGAPVVIVNLAEVPGTLIGDTALSFVAPAMAAARLTPGVDFLLQVRFADDGTATAATPSQYVDLGGGV